MASVTRNCERCGAPIAANVGQAVVRRTLVWHMSYKCAHCGAEVEADDTGLPPEDIRNAILANEGRYGVELPSGGTAGNATMLGLKTMR